MQESENFHFVLFFIAPKSLGLAPVLLNASKCGSAFAARVVMVSAARWPLMRNNKMWSLPRSTVTPRQRRAPGGASLIAPALCIAVAANEGLAAI